MSKKYLLPAKRAFEIRFLPRVSRGKKHFYPRKCLGDDLAVLRWFVGKADKPCARRGCSAEKSQRDFFDGLRPLRKERSFCMSDPEYLLFLRGEFFFGENPLIVKALVFPYLRDVVTGFVDDHLL